MKAIIAAAIVLISAPALAQTEINTLCFCQSGNDAKRYSAEIELTDANRAAVRKSIEAGDLDLRKTVKVSGDGCQPTEWRKNRLCGTTSVQTTKPDGTRENQSFENKPVSGTKILRITNTGGIPRKPGPSSAPIVIDDERWAKVRVLVVGGVEE